MPNLKQQIEVLEDPTPKQLVEEFGLTLQAYSYQKNHKPELFKVYCDAYKYRELLKDIEDIKTKRDNDEGKD